MDPASKVDAVPQSRAHGRTHRRHHDARHPRPGHGRRARLVVAPGFIDLHAHGHERPRQYAFLRAGLNQVTVDDSARAQLGTSTSPGGTASASAGERVNLRASASATSKSGWR